MLEHGIEDAKTFHLDVANSDCGFHVLILFLNDRVCSPGRERVLAHRARGRDRAHGRGRGHDCDHGRSRVHERAHWGR